MISTLPSKIYNLDMLRDEARELVQQGLVERRQPIYTLCRFIRNREWECVEIDLEQQEYLLRDRIGDLLNQERWDSD